MGIRMSDRDRKIRGVIQSYGSIANFRNVYRTAMAPSRSATTPDAIDEEQRRKAIAIWGVDINTVDLDRLQKEASHQ